MMKLMQKFYVLPVFIICMAVSACTTYEPAGRGEAAADDQSIVNLVNQRLSSDPATSRLNLGVSAEGGTVTLTGRIDNPSLKLRALSIAQGVPGVVDVDDQTVRF